MLPTVTLALTSTFAYFSSDNFRFHLSLSPLTITVTFTSTFHFVQCRLAALSLPTSTWLMSRTPSPLWRRQVNLEKFGKNPPPKRAIFGGVTSPAHIFPPLRSCTCNQHSSSCSVSLLCRYIHTSP
jgi:hypothetical protein